MTLQEKNLISEIAYAVLKAYDENGMLIENYYENIILNDLSKKDLESLKNFARFDV
jgi:hypothetical protein